jgi:hypothetical protein
VATERGWHRPRFVSSNGTTTCSRDYLGETADGEQRHRLNVFVRDGDAIRRHWCSEDPRPTGPRLTSTCMPRAAHLYIERRPP